MKECLVVIRADGGNGLGMGHIMRTSVLAEVLSQGARVCYICDKDYRQGIEYLVHQGFCVEEVASEQILDKICSLTPDILLTDHYAVDKRYIDRVEQVCTKVAYIDDNCEKHYKANLILNQNFGAERLDYSTNMNKACKLLLGSRYLLVREPFRGTEPIRIQQEVKDILVTVGGGDPDNITEQILTLVQELPYQFHVVIGGDFPYEAILRSKFNEENIFFYKQPDMLQIMREMDMAISSCGTTLYELGILGIPTLGIIVADNQEGLAYRMKDRELFELVGYKNNLTESRLADKVSTLARNIEKREKLAASNIKVFNKKGVYEVSQAILNLQG